MRAPHASGQPSPGSSPTAGRAGPARVGRIPYLNSVPYFLHWAELERLSDGRWRPHVLVPRRLGRAAASGEVDAGLFAEADLARLEPEFTPLLAPAAGAPHGLGIANRDRVGSVLLFLRAESGTRPPGPAALDAPGRVLTAEEASRLDGRLVALTEESSTSVRLLRILLETRYGVRPTYARGVDAAALSRSAAALVIGDEALRWRRLPPEGFVLGMDLATAWHDWTGLPCLFARWGVRRSVPDASADWLAEFLLRSLREAEPMLASPEAFPISPLAAGAADFGPPEELRAYLRLIHYRLGPEELRAAERFRDHLRRLDLLRADF